MSIVAIAPPNRTIAPRVDPLGAATGEDAHDLAGVGGGQEAAPSVDFGEAEAVEFVDGFCIGG